MVRFPVALLKVNPAFPPKAPESLNCTWVLAPPGGVKTLVQPVALPLRSIPCAACPDGQLVWPVSGPRLVPSRLTWILGGTPPGALPPPPPVQLKHSFM